MIAKSESSSNFAVFDEAWWRNVESRRVNVAFLQGAPYFEFLCTNWVFSYVGIVQKVKTVKKTYVLDLKKRPAAGDL